jgi:uncharacterized Fe-S cluster protein YjdI
MSVLPNIKEYANNEVTVSWQPAKCIHSGICLKALPTVFDLKTKPWINMTGARTEDIVKTVKDCPSKALSIIGVKFKEKDNSDTKVILIPHGPLIIRGGATVENRKEETIHFETVSFCRCGRSAKHPYCDGTHAQKRN